MCEPTTMYVAMQVVSGYMTYETMRQQAKNEDRRNQAIAANAQKAYDDQILRIARREEEEKVAATQAEQDVFQDARKKKATAIASTSESGIGGISADALFEEIAYQEGTVLSRNLTSTKNTMAALSDDRTKAYTNMEARFAGLSNVVQPGFLGTALEVGSTLNRNVDFGGTTDTSKWKFRNV